MLNCFGFNTFLKCGGGSSGGLVPGDDIGPLSSDFVVQRILTGSASYENDIEHSVLIDSDGNVLVRGW